MKKLKTKNTAKKRIIAAMLAVITTFSFASMTVTSASAAMSAKDACQEFALIAGEAGVEKLCSLNPATEVLGKIGIGFLNKVLDSNKPDPHEQTREEIKKSTQEIIGKINDLSDTMTAYHQDETVKLDELSNIAKKNYNTNLISAFNNTYDDVKVMNSDFSDELYANRKTISGANENDKMPTIDYDTYVAYKNVIKKANHTGDRGDMFSIMKYLDSYINGSSSGCDGYKCYNLIADGMKLRFQDDYVPKVMEGGKNFEEFRNIPSVSDTRDKVNEVQSDIVCYYMNCLTVMKMSYDCDNYELNHHYDKDSQKLTADNDKYTELDCSSDSRYATNIDTLNKYMKDIVKNYKSTQSYIDDMVGASVSVDLYQNGADHKATLEFTMPSLAMEAVSSIKNWQVRTGDKLDVTMTLNKDWVADKNYGLAQVVEVSKDTSLFGKGGINYMLNSGESIAYNKLSYDEWLKDINFTLNLNGHKIDLSQKPGQNFLSCDCFNGTLTIKGDEARKSSIIGTGYVFGQNFACNQEIGKINVDGVTIKTNNLDSIAMFCTGPHNINVNNCDITANNHNIFMISAPSRYAVTNSNFHINGAHSFNDISKIYSKTELGNTVCESLDNLNF